jgi:hypothetical protein
MDMIVTRFSVRSTPNAETLTNDSATDRKGAHLHFSDARNACSSSKYGLFSVNAARG